MLNPGRFGNRNWSLVHKMDAVIIVLCLLSPFVLSNKPIKTRHHRGDHPVWTLFQSRSLPWGRVPLYLLFDALGHFWTICRRPGNIAAICLFTMEVYATFIKPQVWKHLKLKRSTPEFGKCTQFKIGGAPLISKLLVENVQSSCNHLVQKTICRLEGKIETSLRKALLMSHKTHLAEWQNGVTWLQQREFCGTMVVKL